MLDFLAINELLSNDERAVRDQARKFLDAEVRPYIAGWWEAGEFPSHLVRQFGEFGWLGVNLPTEYGCAGANNVAYGLLMYELDRIDAGLRSFCSVQGALVMYPIWAYGSEEQKRRWLPAMARGEVIGCFGLTEPSGGSDPGAMTTRARRDNNGWILSGRKIWITNGSIAHVALVWAKDDEGKIHGFLVPAGTPGLEAPLIKHKFSMRASITSELVLDDVRVGDEARLPGAQGLKAALDCLTQARYGIAWGAMGALEAVLSEAREYAATRITFAKPIAARQLVQDKLVRMLTDHSMGLLLAWRLGRLKDAGKLTYAQVSLAKRKNVRAALEGARAAREILGGAGITVEHAAIRHMLNLETVDTYEGTHDIHTLIVGRELTGEDALQ